MMAEATETVQELVEHHGGHQGSNKRIALMIAFLALLLAFAETGVKNSQSIGLAANVEASNLWAFYQAKTIRRTNVLTAAEEMEARLAVTADAEAKAVFEKRIAGWKETAARYESEPSTGEGRKELAARAKVQEERRELYAHKHEWFEFAAAALQIAIVLASAAVITSMGLLVWMAGLSGAAGAAMIAIATLAPHFLLAGH